jgi:hypothetical protein
MMMRRRRRRGYAKEVDNDGRHQKETHADLIF